MRGLILKTINEGAFKPNLASLLTNPYHLARLCLYNAIAHNAKHITGRVLDVGCGSKPYRHLFNCTEYVGLEYALTRTPSSAKADVFYQGGSFPFATDTFDAIVCFQVLEHVFDPETFVRELARALRPGGRLLLTVPFVWPLHEEPHDACRYTCHGLATLLRRHGFEVDEQMRLCRGLALHLQLVLARLDVAWSRLPLKLRLLLSPIVVFPLNLIGRCSLCRTAKSPALYLDNCLLATRSLS